MRTKDHSECAVTIGANVLLPNIFFKDLFVIIRPSPFTLIKSCNWACFKIYSFLQYQRAISVKSSQHFLNVKVERRKELRNFL